MLFQKKNALKVDRSIRSDGYRECDMPVVLWFQSWAEKNGVDYEVLRFALLKARDRNFVVTKQNLMAVVNDAEASSLGMSR